MSQGISQMQKTETFSKKYAKEINAGLYHCTKLPDKERYKYCPANSWCKFKKGLKCCQASSLDPVFIKHLDPIYDRLSDSALLRR